MTTPASDPKIGAWVSFPASAGLLVLFFMPWLRLSCAPDVERLRPIMAGSGSQDEQVARAMMENFSQGPVAVGEATGWQLACGRISQVRPVGSQVVCTPPARQKPRIRPWVFLLLIVPVFLLVLSGAALAGMSTVQGASRGMMWLGLLGVILVFCVSRVDYVNDAFDAQKTPPPTRKRPSPPPLATEQAKEQLRALVKTEPTDYLWGSLGLYALVSVCGLAGLLGRRSAAEGLAAQIEQAGGWRYGSPVPDVGGSLDDLLSPGDGQAGGEASFGPEVAPSRWRVESDAQVPDPLSPTRRE